MATAIYGKKLGSRITTSVTSIALTIAVAAPTLVFAAPPAKPELPKLTIGTIFPMTGPQAAFGREALRGIELGRELLGQRDAELAQRISLLTGDDLSTAKDATTAAEKLAAERAHILVGSLTSASSGAVATVAKKLQLPTIAPLAPPTATPVGAPIFRSAFDESQAAALLATFVLNDLGVKQAATLRDDTLMAQAFTEKFAEVFKAGGGQIVAQEIYDLASDDYTAPLKKLDVAGAKLVATPASYQTAGTLMRQAKKHGMKFSFLGDESWDTKELGKQAGPGASGHYFVTHFADDDGDAATQEFVTAFRAKYGRAPGVIAASTYDAFNLVANAFKLANSNMKGPLAQAIGRTRDFAGVTGKLSFTETGATRITGVIKTTGESGAKFKARAAVPAETTTTATLPKPANVP